MNLGYIPARVQKLIKAMNSQLKILVNCPHVRVGEWIGEHRREKG